MDETSTLSRIGQLRQLRLGEGMVTRLNRIVRLMATSMVLSGAGMPLNAAAEPTIRNPAQAIADLDALIGEAPCTRDDDCATIPVGQSLCGGPAAYRAWSLRDGREAAIRKAAAAIGMLGQTRRPGFDASVCRVLPDPGAQCEKPAGARVGSCRLRIAPGRSTEGLADR